MPSRYLKKPKSAFLKPRTVILLSVLLTCLWILKSTVLGLLQQRLPQSPRVLPCQFMNLYIQKFFATFEITSGLFPALSFWQILRRLKSSMSTKAFSSCLKKASSAFLSRWFVTDSYCNISCAALSSDPSPQALHRFFTCPSLRERPRHSLQPQTWMAASTSWISVWGGASDVPQALAPVVSKECALQRVETITAQSPSSPAQFRGRCRAPLCSCHAKCCSNYCVSLCCEM